MVQTLRVSAVRSPGDRLHTKQGIKAVFKVSMLPLPLECKAVTKGSRCYGDLFLFMCFSKPVMERISSINYESYM